MDKEISNHIAWDNWPKWSQLMGEYFTQDMIYDTNYFDGTNQYFGNGTGIRRYVSNKMHKYRTRAILELTQI